VNCWEIMLKTNMTVKIVLFTVVVYGYQSRNLFNDPRIKSVIMLLVNSCNHCTLFQFETAGEFFSICLVTVIVHGL